MINIKKIYYEKYTKKSYSLSNVDLILERIFSKIKHGIYIDIGCNHPIKYNNTYLLNKKGWKGINVDLDEESINEFNKFRPNDTNICAAVSSKDGENKNIYLYHSRSTINTISKSLVDKRIIKPKKIVNKKTKSLNKIIENTNFRNKKINLISIDVENYEYEVLKNFNFKKYKPDVVVAEIHDINQKKLEIYTQSLNYILKSKLYKLMIKNKYKLVNWVQSDFVFVRIDIKL